MSERDRVRAFPSLRRSLLSWFAGSGVVLVLAYTLLLEHYLELGIALRIKSLLERTATSYAEAVATDPAAPLPTAPGLRSFRHIEDIPATLREQLSLEALRHREMQQFVVLDDGGDRVKAQFPLSPLSCEGASCEFLFFFSYRLDDRTWLYLAQNVAVTEAEDLEYDFIETVALIIGLVFALTLLALALVLSRRIGHPVRRLAHWADNLSVESLDETPDFRFRELNLVAARLRSAFRRMVRGMENEQRFLQHASHELRTPLSVMSGNLELLDKLAERRHRCEAEREAFDRLSRAITNMQQLTETLLWLSRNSEKMPTAEPIELHALMRSLVDENRYLLDSKPVEIVVTGDRSRIHVPSAPCRIVLANLIRNAFQYTSSGRVSIDIAHDHITIDNECEAAVEEDAPSEDGEFGFGLGLKLVDELCRRLGWGYESSPRRDGRSTTVRFHAPGTQPINDDEPPQVSSSGCGKRCTTP